MEVVKTYQRKYKIVYFIDGLGMGGAERLMVPILKNLDKNRFEPRVCVFQVRGGNPISDELKSLGIPVDLLHIPYLRDITALPRLRRYLKDFQADLVHTQLELGDTLGNIVSKWLRLPSICTIHSMPSQEMTVKSRIHQEVELFSLRYFCDKVIAVSDEARRFHIDISNTFPEKIITLYNGIDLTIYSQGDFAKEREIVRSELGIPADSVVLTTVAVLRQPKGIQYMIRALPHILQSFPNAYYVIVGDGAYREALEREVVNAGVQQRVVFSGLRKDIPRILSAADIFILPTLTEALPTVLAEAMAARLPIIASAVGGIPEMVIDGENGKLIKAGEIQELVDVTKKLLAEPTLRKRMGELGWEVVYRKFNIKEQVRLLEGIYLDLIESYVK